MRDPEILDGWTDRDLTLAGRPIVGILLGDPASFRRPPNCVGVLNATADDVRAWREAYMRRIGRRHRVKRRTCRAAQCRTTSKDWYDFGAFGVVLCDEHAPSLVDGAWVMRPGAELKPARRPAAAAQLATRPPRVGVVEVLAADDER